jgi:hypothetical protein
VIPVGATQEYVPAVVYACCPVSDAGTALLLAPLRALEPNAFVATTLAVYVLPVVRPLIVIGEEDPVLVKVAPLEESVAIAVYPVIGPAPTLDGAVKAIESVVAPVLVNVPIVGASGTFNGKYEAVKIPA